jgi:hypothetical protein
MSQRTLPSKSPRPTKPPAKVAETPRAAGRKPKAGRAQVLKGTVLPLASASAASAPQKAGSAPPKRKAASKGASKGAAKGASKGAAGRGRPAKGEAQTGNATQDAGAKPKAAARGPAGLQLIEAPLRARRTKAQASTGHTKRGKRVFSAATSDPHELYQLAVQSPGVDAAFLAKLYKKLRGREARHVREDFCGTAYFISAWLRRHKENTAEGYDIDLPTVQWGREHNFEGLDGWTERTKLFIEDVRKPSERAPDIRFAPNFSWMIFTERAVLLDYFKQARADLAEGGLFVFDIYGGWESAEEMEEQRRIDAGFTYVWQQREYHPATGFYHCAIHFRFKDGSELRDVYDYRWRLWSLPEVVDILKDAGFKQVDSYWEGTDADEVSGNGIFKRDPRGENCPAWVTYVVAQG